MRERIHDSASSLLHASMELQTEVDPSIEGGFIFDINDFRLDASIATQLKKVKQQFIDKNRRIVWFTIWQFTIYLFNSLVMRKL